MTTPRGDIDVIRERIAMHRADQRAQVQRAEEATEQASRIVRGCENAIALDAEEIDRLLEEL